MKFFPGKNIDFFLTCRQNREAVSQVANILSFEPIIVINRIGANRIYTSLSRLSLTDDDTRFSVLAATFLSANVEAHSNTSHVTLAAVSKDLENAAIEKRKKRASLPREIRISGCIVDRIVLRNIFASSAKFFFLFFLYQRPVPKTLSFDLFLSLPVFSDREEENGRGVAPKATNEREKRKGKESLERSNKTRASIHGWKPVEKSFSRSSLSSARRCGCVLYVFRT